MLFRRSYSLSIPEPCRESWQQMQPMEQGRYCGNCSKVVTDFTGKTEKEIAGFFKHRPQQVCGRFNHEQLLKTYTRPAVNVLPLHRRLSKYLLGILLTGAAVEKASAQEPVETVLQKDSLSKDSMLTMAPEVRPDSLELACDTIPAAPPADSVATDSVKIHWDLQPHLWIASTYTIGIEMVTLGAIAVMPPERINPLDYLFDSLVLAARKMRLKRAAGKASPVAALAELPRHNDEPRNRGKAPLKLPVQEAIMPASLGWKPKKGGRLKNS